MNNKEKAEKEILELYKQVEKETDVISNKYKDFKGLDGPASSEIRKLRKEFLKQRKEILIKYGLPIPK